MLGAKDTKQNKTELIHTRSTQGGRTDMPVSRYQQDVLSCNQTMNKGSGSSADRAARDSEKSL